MKKEFKTLIFTTGCGGKFDPAAFDAFLNDQAREGWEYIESFGVLNGGIISKLMGKMTMAVVFGRTTGG